MSYNYADSAASSSTPTSESHSNSRKEILVSKTFLKHQKKRIKALEKKVEKIQQSTQSQIQTLDLRLQQITKLIQMLMVQNQSYMNQISVHRNFNTTDSPSAIQPSPAYILQQFNSLSDEKQSNGYSNNLPPPLSLPTTSSSMNTISTGNGNIPHLIFNANNSTDDIQHKRHKKHKKHKHNHHKNRSSPTKNRSSPTKKRDSEIIKHRNIIKKSASQMVSQSNSQTLANYKQKYTITSYTDTEERSEKTIATSVSPAFAVDHRNIKKKETKRHSAGQSTLRKRKVTLHFSDSDSDSDSEHYRQRKRIKYKLQKIRSVDNATHMKLQASQSERIQSNTQSFVHIKANERMENDLLDDLTLLELDVESTESETDSDIDRDYEEYQKQLRNASTPEEEQSIASYTEISILPHFSSIPPTHDTQSELSSDESTDSLNSPEDESQKTFIYRKNRSTSGAKNHKKLFKNNLNILNESDDDFTSDELPIRRKISQSVTKTLHNFTKKRDSQPLMFTDRSRNNTHKSRSITHKSRSITRSAARNSTSSKNSNSTTKSFSSKFTSGFKRLKKGLNKEPQPQPYQGESLSTRNTSASLTARNTSSLQFRIRPNPLAKTEKKTLSNIWGVRKSTSGFHARDVSSGAMVVDVDITPTSNSHSVLKTKGQIVLDRFSKHFSRSRKSSPKGKGAIVQILDEDVDDESEDIAILVRSRKRKTRKRKETMDDTQLNMASILSLKKAAETPIKARKRRRRGSLSDVSEFVSPGMESNKLKSRRDLSEFFLDEKTKRNKGDEDFTPPPSPLPRISDDLNAILDTIISNDSSYELEPLFANDILIFHPNGESGEMDIGPNVGTDVEKIVVEKKVVEKKVVKKTVKIEISSINAKTSLSDDDSDLDIEYDWTQFQQTKHSTDMESKRRKSASAAMKEISSPVLSPAKTVVNIKHLKKKKNSSRPVSAVNRKSSKKKCSTPTIKAKSPPKRKKSGKKSKTRISLTKKMQNVKNASSSVNMNNSSLSVAAPLQIQSKAVKDKKQGKSISSVKKKKTVKKNEKKNVKNSKSKKSSKKNSTRKTAKSKSKKSEVNEVENGNESREIKISKKNGGNSSTDSTTTLAESTTTIARQ